MSGGFPICGTWNAPWSVTYHDSLGCNLYQIWYSPAFRSLSQDAEYFRPWRSESIYLEEKNSAWHLEDTHTDKVRVVRLWSGWGLKVARSRTFAATEVMLLIHWQEPIIMNSMKSQMTQLKTIWCRQICVWFACHHDLVVVKGVSSSHIDGSLLCSYKLFSATRTSMPWW